MIKKVLNNLRKMWLGSKYGLIVYFGGVFTIFGILIYRQRGVVSIIISIVVGVILGFVMNYIYRRRFGYFINVIRNDKTEQSKKYKKLYKENSVAPKDEDIEEYHAYLQTTRKLYGRPIPWTIVSFILFGSMLALSFIYNIAGFSRYIFIFAILLSIYNLIQANAKRKRIDNIL